jgi:hypothetical protein
VGVVPLSNVPLDELLDLGVVNLIVVSERRDKCHVRPSKLQLRHSEPGRFFSAPAWTQTAREEPETQDSWPISQNLMAAATTTLQWHLQKLSALR